MGVMRIHRGLKNLVGKIDASAVANKAEDYLEAYKYYKRDLKGIRGIANEKRLKTSIKKIDALEREILKLEERIDRLQVRREQEAVKLEDLLYGNLDVLAEYLEPDEMRDFPS